MKTGGFYAQIGISSIKGLQGREGGGGPVDWLLCPPKRELQSAKQSWLSCPNLDNLFPDCCMKCDTSVYELRFTNHFSYFSWFWWVMGETVPPSPSQCEVDETQWWEWQTPYSCPWVGGMEGFSAALDWAASWQVNATHFINEERG